MFHTYTVFITQSIVPHPLHYDKYSDLSCYTSSLLFSPSMPPYVQYDSMQVHTPAPLFIDHILAHSSPLDMVGLSHHFLAAPLSPCLPLRTLFASNTCMHVYMSISLHIARSTIIHFPHAPIHLPR